MSTGPVSRPWRRFLRFSVRGMIVVVLLMGGWLGWIVRSARIQREAVAAIESAGGHVWYDWADDDGDPGGPWWAPRWLVAGVGVDFLGQVTAVSLNASSTPSDEAVARIRCLSQLELLDLSRSSFSDAQLAHVEGMTSLTLVILNDSTLTDAALVHLKGMTNLHNLNLENTRVTDAGVRELERALPGVSVLR
jgi:internalin A